MKSIDLCIPIYLNQQIVFDLLAVFDDGFSRLSTIKTSSGESETNKYGMGASIGVSNVFALLGVSFSGERGKEKETQGQTEISQEKVHTPTSLFAKLRLKLQERELLKILDTADSLEDIANGDFVEFSAVLRKNPIVDTIEGFKQVMEVAVVFTDKKGSSSKTQQKGQRPKNTDALIMRQMDGMISALTQENTVEIIGELDDTAGLKAVLSAKLDFFSQGGVSEIIDGDFRVLGKVVRVLKSEGSINLLRKTTFGRFDQRFLDQLSGAFEGVEEAGLSFPKLVTEISPPAVQIIPIAIFT